MDEGSYSRKSSNNNVKAPDKALFGKESGVRGKKMMKKIIRNVKKLQGNYVLEDTQIRTFDEFEVGIWLEELEVMRKLKNLMGKCLGPHFIDWWMQKPLPVDADLLPEVIPGFRPLLRLSPPNT
ncbi:hypothetical protein REPUB_Repub17cG0003300 [Reevesia pubescens]